MRKNTQNKTVNKNRVCSIVLSFAACYTLQFEHLLLIFYSLLQLFASWGSRK